MESACEAIQKARHGADDLQAFVADLRHWEQDMQRQEASLGRRQTDVRVGSKELPPVRNEPKKAISSSKPKKSEKRISSYDYSAWEKFDADEACDGLDKKASFENTDEIDDVKSQKLREEANLEKEKGNNFVGSKKWEEAISCYTRAIELYRYEATYFANRALCHLKKENLHAAEADCTSALELDSTYAKALLRRSSAREGLGSLRRAASDLNLLLKLEPNNEAVKRQLASLVSRMGTKGPNSKSSPATTPSDSPQKMFFSDDSISKDDSKESEKNDGSLESINEIENEKLDFNRPNQLCEVQTIQAVDKPPHLRSKKHLKRIPIVEVPKGSVVKSVLLKSRSNESNELLEKHLNSKTFRPNNTRLKSADKCVIKEITQIKPDVLKDQTKAKSDAPMEKSKEQLSCIIRKSESIQLDKTEIETITISDIPIEKFSVPKSSIQFLSDWRLLKGRDKDLSSYLKAIKPTDLPIIFQNSLESDVLSEILNVIHEGVDFNKNDFTSSIKYLKSLSEVKRFSALAMFLCSSDKNVLSKVLQRCKEKEGCSDDDIKQIKNKYEL